MATIFSDNFSAPPFGRELELLVRCAGTHTAPATVARIQDLARQGIDWDLLWSLAEQHGTLPLLRGCLQSVNPAQVPSVVWERLDSWFLANATRSLYAASQLVEIASQLKDEGIRAIPFKGPVLARLAFGDIAARHFGDLDLLVAERDYVRCGDLLVSSGFRCDEDNDYEMSYVDDANNLCIDLHRSVVDFWRWPVRLDFDRLWERRTYVSMLGFQVPSLDLANLTVILSMQLVRDTWTRRVRISKIADLAQLMAASSRLDWELVEREADRVGCKRMVIFALRSAHEILTTSQPTSLPGFVLDNRPAAIPLTYVRRHLCDVIGQGLADRLLRVGFELWTLRRLVDTEALRLVLGDKTVDLLDAVWSKMPSIGVQEGLCKK